jgi:hypothetical protein
MESPTIVSPESAKALRCAREAAKALLSLEVKDKILAKVALKPMPSKPSGEMFREMRKGSLGWFLDKTRKSSEKGRGFLGGRERKKGACSLWPTLTRSLPKMAASEGKI